MALPYFLSREWSHQGVNCPAGCAVGISAARALELSQVLPFTEHCARCGRKISSGQPGRWCPACQCCHPFDCWPGAGRPDGPGWTFDGNVELPTFSPSLRIFYARDGNMITTCHFVIERGVIKYCGDYQSEFAGRQVQMEPIPEDYGT